MTTIQNSRITETAEFLARIAENLDAPEQRAYIMDVIRKRKPEHLEKLVSIFQRPDVQQALKNQSIAEGNITFCAAQMEKRKNESRTRRQIKTQIKIDKKQGIETISHHLGLTGARNGNKYCAKHSLTVRDRQEQSWKNALKGKIISRGGRNGEDEISMAELIEHSQSKRFYETYTLVKGMEQEAERNGLTWAFITLTVPPHMHPNPKNGNRTWDGTTPAEANRFINNNWSATYDNLRSSYKIKLIAVHVAEAQNDGAPHWHAIIFACASDMQIIERELRSHKCWRTKAGCDFKLGKHDKDSASAATYICKYLQKTLNNKSSDKELSAAAKANIAWRSAWRIRAHEFLGIPPKNLWRHFRSLPVKPEHELLGEVWQAAHDGDAATFIRLNGGLGMGKRMRNIRSKLISEKSNPIKIIRLEVKSTGEIFDFAVEKFTEKEVDTQKLLSFIDAAVASQSQ